MDPDNGYSHAYPIELLARNPIEIDRSALADAMRRRFGEVSAPEPTGAEALKFMAFLKDYPVAFKEGTIPAQLALLSASGRPDSNGHRQAIQQSWAFPDAAGTAQACRHACLLINLMSSPLPHETRRRIIANGLAAVLETASVDLVHWTATMQMLKPAEVLERFSDPQEMANPTYGFLNVRFYTVPNRDGDMILDTLGLNALGLTDLQIHCRLLEPGRVADMLYSLGRYLFEKGDVIDDGHTVQGLAPEDRWRCRREVSLLEPRRVVLDIDPGPPFAAGDRT